MPRLIPKVARALLLSLLALIAPNITVADNSQAAVLESISTQARAASSEIVLQFTGAVLPVQARHFALESPARYVVDLPGTRSSDTLPQTIPLNDARVARARIGQHQTRLRVVLDLPAPLVNVELQESDNLLRLVFSDTAPGEDEAPTAQVDSRSETPAVSATADDTPAPAPSPAEKVNSERSSPQTFVFGAGASNTTEAPQQRPVAERGATEQNDWAFTLDRGLVEAGQVYGDDGGTNLHVQAIAAVEGPLTQNLRLRLAVRADGQYQYGDLPELERTRGDYDESWLRFESGNWRATAGAQRIIWGRTDEFSPTDLLSTRDFTRLILDDVQDRRRANPALRLQWLGGDQQFDIVYLPSFREAELPGRESIWFPVDRSSGAVAGLPLPDAARDLLVGAVVRNDIDGDAGIGLRYSRTGERLDFALTGQRVHNPEPYFTVGRPPAGGNPAELTTVYQRTTALGGDVATTVGAWTLRAEAVWLSDAPYTDASTFELRQSEAVNWAVGAEIFPGGGDLRWTNQISGRHLLDADSALDFTDILTLYGEFEAPFNAAGLPWRAQLRYSWRLDEDGVYLNPELTFTGWEPSEVYIGLHVFDGDYGTAEGFYSDRDMAVIGWRAKF